MVRADAWYACCAGVMPERRVLEEGECGIWKRLPVPVRVDSLATSDSMMVAITPTGCHDGVGMGAGAILAEMGSARGDVASFVTIVMVLCPLLTVVGDDAITTLLPAAPVLVGLMGAKLTAGC